MNRALQYLNLVGVVAVGALCVTQWQVNRRANLEVIGLEKVRQGQSAKIEEQGRTLKGYALDLDSFREQLSRTAASLKETDSKLIVTERQLQQLDLERQQLKTSVTNWAAAVTARDEQLRQINERLTKLAVDRNDAVEKFNDLAAKYNGVVKDLNEARTRLAQISTNAVAK